ncbi:MAG: carboxymuconolactone decarboxylase family protein, partial [Candidatus Binataceae bacterium]
NMVAFMANSPVVLGAHVSLAGAYHDATLASELRELVAAAVAERSGCDYTLSAACQTALALCKTP